MLQLSTDIRNAQADAVETAIGTSAVLQVFTGSQPANCAAADTGVLLGEITLPADFWSAASNGTKTKVGTWTGTGLPAAGAGTNAGHFRVKNGSACKMQGSITVTGGGGDVTMNNITIVASDPFQVNTFTYVRGNA